MNHSGLSTVVQTITHNEAELLSDWMSELVASGAVRNDIMKQSDVRSQCTEFLHLLSQALNTGESDHRSEAFEPLRGMLEEFSRARAYLGITPTETATFVFSFKRPLSAYLRKELSARPDELLEALWQATLLIDNIGLYTVEVHQRARDEIISRQQQEMLELSTPVVKLWDGILALPLIGTLDSARTQIVMETLLQAIVETSCGIAIIDITGVPTVDTLVAQHLLKTVAAARLMGADCIISGIRPQIAQTIVHLGVDLADVVTKATLADAFTLALQRTGIAVDRRSIR